MNNNTTANVIPANALILFDLYIRDAGNWSGTPLVGSNVCLLGEREDRGLLTHLKKAGVIRTFVDEGCTWLQFTDAGKALAISRGLDVSSLAWAI